jgi:hypothetical protein
VPFRDDRDALIERAAALERENQRLREENERLRIEPVPEPAPEPAPEPEPAAKPMAPDRPSWWSRLWTWLRRRRDTPELPLTERLPVNRDAYQKLLQRKQRKIVVGIDVKFATPGTRAQRDMLRQKVDATGYVSRWEDDVLVVRSGKLHLAGKRTSPIIEFCDAIFAHLETLHEEHPIVMITPHARRRK